MKSINFKCYLLVFVFLFSYIFVGCTKSVSPVVSEKSNEKIKLSCAIPAEDTAKIKAFKSFETNIKKQFSDYDISFKYIKGDTKSYETKIKVLLSSNQKPDIFFSKENSFFEQLFSANAVQPIDKYLKELKFWHMVLPFVKNDGYKGKVYAVPFEEVHYEIMAINSDIFNKNKIKIPTNFEELKNAVYTLKSKGIIPIAIGGKDGGIVYNMIGSFAATIDPEVTKNVINGKEKFSSNNFKEAVLKVKELIDMEAFGKETQCRTDLQAAQLFNSGKAAIYCTSSSNLNMCNKKLNGKCKLIYYPYIGEENVNNYNSLVSDLQKNSGLFISSISEHPKEAVNLAIEISKEYNKYLYEKQNNPATIYIPSKQGWENNNKNNKDLQQFMKSLYENKNITSSLLNGSINVKASKAIMEASTAFMTGFLSVDTYTKELDKAMELKF
ncbi:raffinose/stachyose/melibiose transport system substrate-binding protein [Clostridium tetanomorphum]|uniref:ABC transporter substrate-binding protein n=1 Tax=Clostridium tetanomorphum TaxID=1553 RepID=UPI000450E312|nr:extracellular solute-binding protein [Clostridium tetanomorphum]KAJ50248.1 sugar ABC transporter periplasmic protein [Clostridium tetanomorphum DSM 665]MBP1864389.1 raffinose/stachyose/melibiose transport system substrate-binding protein [Clostridium tetanomorphum]NRS83835.1 raffinose/stachyose/melibiose transport system substrate-binding protein [Clostridium tetanomorphum]SQB93256.1 carbohydrate ABC transporter substrate-binding protein, CUT1 family [Clostridium tetanomorphum]